MVVIRPGKRRGSRDDYTTFIRYRECRLPWQPVGSMRNDPRFFLGKYRIQLAMCTTWLSRAGNKVHWQADFFLDKKRRFREQGDNKLKKKARLSLFFKVGTAGPEKFSRRGTHNVHTKRRPSRPGAAAEFPRLYIGDRITRTLGSIVTSAA